MEMKKLVPRGFLRSHILRLLKSGPKHGYEIIKLIERKTSWSPSPGAVYPTLHELMKSGFVTKSTSKNKRRIHYRLTKKGKLLTEKLEKSMNDMKDKFSSFIGVMSQILEVNETELRNIVKKHEQKGGFFLLPKEIRELIFKSENSLIKVARDKSKHKELKKILSESYIKLKKLVGE
jgi:DNA-binding PadR family transcriptional regulator